MGETSAPSFVRTGFRFPILLLTGLTDIADLVRGLDSGANDYVGKPFHCSELLARLRAHLRVARASGDGDLPVGPFRFRQALGTLERSDGTIHARLPAKEAAILKLLIRSGSEPVASSTLLRNIWRERPQSASRSLKTHISRLRQKLESDRSQHRVIVKHGDGYLLDVRALSDAPAQPDESNRALQMREARDVRKRAAVFPPFRG